jgi:hypothetical protein
MFMGVSSRRNFHVAPDDRMNVTKMVAGRGDHKLDLGSETEWSLLFLTLSEVRGDTGRQATRTLKSTIFWDITPFSPLKVNRRFERTYRLHLQG